MKMTSCLERSLGDVYLMIGTDCPFLLRDLLASAELAKILSKPAMDVMKIFLGSPESLNLRNILWHGFASPYEIPPKYCTTLLLLTAGLGQLVRNYLSQTQSSLEHRPYFVFYNPEAMQVFPDINDDVLSFAETFIEKSTFVLVHMVPFWTEAFTAFREGRYADCAVLLLPQLETGLRLIFASVNKCPNRILTAESAVLYTTFDEILAKQLDNESDNKVLHTLGEPAMEFLWDMLNHQEGPRVRDHLSHGEIQLDDFPREIANQILGFSVMLLCKQLHQDDTFSQAISIFKPLFDAAECYRSVFHPIALLQKQVLECSESLQKWSLLPSPSQDHSHKVTGSDDITYPGIILHQDTTYILSQLERQVTDYIDIDNLDTWLLTDKWFSTMNMLCRKYITNLYCHRWVLEAVGVLRKVIKHCYIVSSNIISTSELRYEQWLCKALHSRQRQNYLRMLSSIKVLTPIFRLIVLLVTVELHNIHSVSEKTAADYQKYIKYIKAILQYTENLSTCTSLDKNRWDEAIELSRGILLKIRRFYENMNQYSH
ncbi:endoplasmic reticulum membrane-associated RNA degradation protein [Rhinophrynus dorsalis]